MGWPIQRDPGANARCVMPPAGGADAVPRRSPGRRGSHPVPSLTLSAPTAQDWGRVRPSRRASVVRQPPWDPPEKGLYVDYLYPQSRC